MRTLVVGLGNPILTDDGVGVRVADAVADALPTELADSTTVTEASVGGLRLMELMVGYDRAIIIDAIQLPGEPTMGRIHRMSLSDLESISPTQHSASAHDTSLVTALEAGRRLGLVLPDDVIVFAVEVENVSDFGDTPTPAVAGAIPAVTQQVLDVLTGPNGTKAAG